MMGRLPPPVCQQQTLPVQLCCPSNVLAEISNLNGTVADIDPNCGKGNNSVSSSDIALVGGVGYLDFHLAS